MLKAKIKVFLNKKILLLTLCIFLGHGVTTVSYPTTGSIPFKNPEIKKSNKLKNITSWLKRHKLSVTTATAAMAVVIFLLTRKLPKTEAVNRSTGKTFGSPVSITAASPSSFSLISIGNKTTSHVGGVVTASPLDEALARERATRNELKSFTESLNAEYLEIQTAYIEIVESFSDIFFQEKDFNFLYLCADTIVTEEINFYDELIDFLTDLLDVIKDYIDNIKINPVYIITKKKEVLCDKLTSLKNKLDNEYFRLIKNSQAFEQNGLHTTLADYINHTLEKVIENIFETSEYVSTAEFKAKNSLTYPFKNKLIITEIFKCIENAINTFNIFQENIRKISNLNPEFIKIIKIERAKINSSKEKLFNKFDATIQRLSGRHGALVKKLIEAKKNHADAKTLLLNLQSKAHQSHT